MDAFSLDFTVSNHEQVGFDCTGASGSRFKPPLLSLRASIVALPFLQRFLRFFVFC